MTRYIDGLRAAFPLLRRIRSVSFSQYGEDLLFSFLHPRRTGFYVDVGAYHPWMESNTYKLYLRGWSGITIEPNPDQAHLFRHFRPRDIHLTLGVSTRDEELVYHRYADQKLNKFAAHIVDNTDVIRVDKIRCLPLREIIKKNCPDREIDLLSIDCEGLDFDVLTSIDLRVSRPVSIIIEDFEQFSLSKNGGDLSKIKSYLLNEGYCMISQGLFSFIYVDMRRLASGASHQHAFDFGAVQF